MLFSLAFAAPLPSGTWTFSRDPAEVAAVEAIRESILGEYNFAIRAIVRSHLRHPLAIHDTIRFVPDGPATRVELQGQEASGTYTVQLDGPRLSGDEGSVELRSDGDGWVLDLIGAQQGRIVHRFEPHGGELQVQTTITSPRLDGSHSWTLTYRTP